MKSYNWRRNFSDTVYNGQGGLSGKLAFKTKSIDWINTCSPIVIPISIHTVFHEGLAGHLKMRALIRIIRENAKGLITVLMTEKAHVKALSLCYQLDHRRAYSCCRKEAEALENRFANEFCGCSVAYWDPFLSQDSSYTDCWKMVMKLYKNDFKFREHLYRDARATYTPDRQMKFPDKALYLSKTIEDILEQCVGLKVLIEKGYRFQLYPGFQYEAVQYVKQTLTDSTSSLEFVHVFLSIEKKKFCTNNTHTQIT